MANVKISQLPSLSTMTDLAQVPVVAGGTTYQITGANLSSYFNTNAGNITSTTDVNITIDTPDSSTFNWQFGADGSLTLPIGVSIDNNVGPLYPKIIADSGKLFSVQGQGNTGSAALAWTVNPNAASQYAAVAVTRAGGDNLAKVVLQAQSDSGNAATVKLWKFDETGDLSAPGNIIAPSLTTNNIRSDDSSFVNIEDGVNVTGAVVASGNITSGNISTGIITLTNGAVIKDNAGDSVAFGQSAGGTSQGNSSVALGQNAGATGQGTFAVAIGRNAGDTSQGGSAVAVGVSAGDTSQGTSAVAIGSSAGFTNQSANTVAVGVGAGQSTQGVDAVAIGNAAGSLTQGIAAVAIGTLAGRTFQANNSIILNATGANLNQTTANTFTVAPVRNDVANIGNVIFYNATSKEITYGNTISVAGNIIGGNLSAVNLVINNIRSDDSSFVNIEDGVNVTGAIDASGNITGGNVLTGGTVVTTPVAYSTLTAVTGARAFVNDGNLVASSNFGAQVSGGGANTVPVWSNGTNWYIG